MMAQDYAVLRDVPGAEREFLQALRLRPQTAGLHLQLGELYARAQQWDKAEEQFRLETQLQPGSPEAFYRLGEALLQSGKFHEAREALVQSNQLREDMPETLYQLGKAAAMDGDATMAQQSWQHLLSSEKDTALAASAFWTVRHLSQTGKARGRRSRNGRIPQVAEQPRPHGRFPEIGNIENRG
jgi:tetratricopeptide (TPR) repeat protein